MVETLAFRSMVSVGKNFDDLKDVVELRRFLDLGCADEVCAKVKGTEQPELGALVDAMVSSAERGEDFLYADIDFHMGLLDPLGNTIAKQMVHSLWLVHMAVLPQIGLAPSEKMLDTAEAHRRMLDAAIAGDARCTVRPYASITGRSNRYCANTSPCADAWSLRGVGPRSVCAARHEARCTDIHQMSDV